LGKITPSSIKFDRSIRHLWRVLRIIQEKRSSISLVIVDMGLVVIGIILLLIQTTINTLSAILITGLLFLIIGSYGIISFLIQNFSTKDLEVKAEKKVEEITTKKVPKYKISQKTNSKDKKCDRCGELYPEETLHQNCIICGDPL